MYQKMQEIFYLKNIYIKIPFLLFLEYNQIKNIIIQA